MPVRSSCNNTFLWPMQFTIQQLDDILNEIGYLLYDYNIAERVVRSLGAVEKVSGYTKEEFDKADIDFWMSLIHPDDMMIVRQVQAKFILEGGAYQGFYRIQRKTGEYVLVQDKGFAFKPESGIDVPKRMVGMISPFTDKQYPL